MSNTVKFIGVVNMFITPYYKYFNSDKNEDNNMSNKLLSNDKLENKIKNENYININENSDSEIQIYFR